MTEKMSENLLKKALDSNLGIMPPVDKKNGLDIPEFREPNFNELTIQKRIDALSKEISDMQHQAFGVRTVRHSEFWTEISKYINDIGVITSGIDIIDLQTKIALRDSLTENLKTERLRCICESKQFTRPVDENSNPICGGCGKII